MKLLKLMPVLMITITQTLFAQSEDPYMWLEDIDGEKSMDFVKAHNEATFNVLSKQKDYQDIYDKCLAIYDSKDKIIFPTIYGDYIYNFWQDDEHVRGIWRRTPKKSYLADKPVWETVLDIDALSAKDNVKWVFKGANGLYPTYDRFLLNLSNGGGDAVAIKEFDVNKKEFINDGFNITEAKGDAYFVDMNTVILSTDFGEGTMTTSGYPRQTKIWKRGTALKDAKLIYEGAVDDVGAWGFIYRDGDKKYLGVVRAPGFFTSESYIYENNKLIKLDIPEDCQTYTVINGQLVLSLKSDWDVMGTSYKQGALISMDMDALLKGEKLIHTIIQPDASSSIEAVSNTKNKLLVNLTTNVKNVLFIYNFLDNTWKNEKVATPDFGTIGINATDESSDLYFFNFTNFLTPTTLYVANAGDNSVKPFKFLPAFFDASKYEVNQYTVKSTDGTAIPYFVVSAKNMQNNGQNPTLLTAYGGFEVSILPYYSGTVGQSWLDMGGVYVVANIRGGGEFGPQWHQAGMLEKRQNIYDDFHAVAQDLITRKITSPKHLGIKGGSNGGLLMGVAFTQRPDLYNAVLCEVPLLDMQRYNKLLAGASWMAEYGNPDVPADWEFISKYSPYQNLKEGKKYPEVFFLTSTRDDRVHPGHARKMAAKMEGMGYKVYYYENIEGGHGASSTNDQIARRSALEYSYLLMKLK